MKSFLLGTIFALFTNMAHAELDFQPRQLAGNWNIQGKIVDKDKKIVSCKMEKPLQTGGSFMAVVVVHLTRFGLEVLPIMVVPSSLKEGSQVNVNFMFDGKIGYNLTGLVNSDKVINISLSEENEAAKGFAGYFKTASNVKITSSLKGNKDEIVNINLTGSSSAFDANEDCLAEMLDKTFLPEKPSKPNAEKNKPSNQEEKEVEL